MRLRHTTPDSRGIARTRRGRGYSYIESDGAPVDDPTRTRIRRLAIPPAWQSVWICPYSNGHIQAVGLDAAGRKQYIYHEQWRSERDREKHDRALRLGARMPKFRAEVDKDLRSRGISQKRAAAVALRLLDRGVFRVGGEKYAEDNGTYGVATLLREHVRISKDTIAFDFPAKGGIRRTTAVTDADLANALRALRRNRHSSERLLVYATADELRSITSDEVNARFKALVGQRYSVKDLRTWNATVLAAVAFVDQERPHTKRARSHAISEVMREVSKGLGNTPAIARKSYVDPRVVEAYAVGDTIAPAVRRAALIVEPEEARLTLERAVIRLIKRHRD